VIYHGNEKNGWRDHSFYDLERVVRRASARLRPALDEFDSIVVTGVSGMAVGFPLALRLKKPIAVLRKAGDDTHSFKTLEGGDDLGERVLFVDDFVSNGATRARVIDMVEKDPDAKVVGTYQYRDDLLEWGPTATPWDSKRRTL